MASQFIRSRFSSLREYLTPLSHESTFAMTGEITPEEFVQAGDYLETRFPTWQWARAAKGKEREFLPIDKQYLVTRHVPCYNRVKDYEAEAEGGQKFEKDVYIDNVGDDEAWTEMGVQQIHPRVSKLEESFVKESSDDESTDINDIDDLIDETVEDDIGYQPNSNTQDIGMRSYDLYISYSTSYRVPKMYLVGFDAEGSPLTPEEMFEDISSDYRHKTVTIEKAPFLFDTTVVSIHPCRHATVMKILMKRAAAAALAASLNKEHEDQLIKNVSKLGLADNNNNSNDNNDKEEDDDDDEGWEDLDGQQIGIRVDQYLIVFLKFMSSVTPGIEHDYTMEAL